MESLPPISRTVRFDPDLAWDGFSSKFATMRRADFLGTGLNPKSENAPVDFTHVVMQENVSSSRRANTEKSADDDTPTSAS